MLKSSINYSEPFSPQLSILVLFCLHHSRITLFIQSQHSAGERDRGRCGGRGAGRPVDPCHLQRSSLPGPHSALKCVTTVHSSGVVECNYKRCISPGSTVLVSDAQNGEGLENKVMYIMSEKGRTNFDNKIKWL